MAKAHSWLQGRIVFTVDHGEEFGGQSWLKVTELRKLIGGFGCRIIQNHGRHCEENAHVERSHRTVREHSSLDYQTPCDYLRRTVAGDR